MLHGADGMKRLVIVACMLALAAGCGLFGDDRGKQGKRKQRQRRPFDQPGAMVPVPNNMPEGSPKLHADLVNGPKLDAMPEGAPGLVVLAVLDTVRADHTSICGYERDTTPALKALVEKGGQVACHAYAPGTWTLPSHASLFTGTDPEEHGLFSRGIALSKDAETLAEIYAARGYQTLFLSANPILKKPTGLVQGFHASHVARGIVSTLNGPGFTKMLKLQLSQLDPTRPLFLVLNIYDAHDPYPAIPAGKVDWAPQRPPFSFKTGDRTDKPAYAAYRDGSLQGEERQAFLDHITDTYDFGIFMADANVGRTVKILDKFGFSKHGVRMVVTSDHGENLGEHDRLKHDGPPLEGVARVPVVVFDNTREAPVELPDTLSVTDLFHVVKDGDLPKQTREARSGSIRYGPKADKWFDDAMALWPSPTHKLMFWTDRSFRIDLDADPGERSPLPIEDAEDAKRLDAAVERQNAARDEARGKATDDKVMKLLEQVGYVE